MSYGVFAPFKVHAKVPAMAPTQMPTALMIAVRAIATAYAQRLGSHGLDKLVQKQLIQRLDDAMSANAEPSKGQTHRLSAKRYTCEDEYLREQQTLFSRYPVIVGHQSQLPNVGDYLTTELAGVPLVAIRSEIDTISVFINACRHRGAKLLNAERGQCKTRLICPYHAWSYDRAGHLVGVPKESSFGELDKSALGLHEVHSELRHGFIWVTLTPGEQPVSVADHLGAAMNHDLASLNTAEHEVFRSERVSVNANWKLVMDAFAEGYHVSALHKESIAPFFFDVTLLDDFTPHVRQVGARKSLADVDRKRFTDADFREATTGFYNLFPNSIFVLHPLWISQVMLEPKAADRVDVVHNMLVPVDENLRASDARLERSFQLIHNEVFVKEDLNIAASIQSTLKSGLEESLILGSAEEGVRLFHAARDKALKG